MAVQESFHFLSTDNDRTRPKLPFPETFFWDLARQGAWVGTSSWKFRGWEGFFYGKHYRSEAEFQRECLREYAKALPMVGIDFTFYDWPHVNQIVAIANAVPENFRFCVKATDKLVTERFPNVARYGRFAGKENPLFLDPQAFLENFWKPLAAIQKQIGAVIFEFPHLALSQLDRLEAFFEALPADVPCALELRSRELFGPDFYRRLLERNVAPAMNSWSRMPPLASQWNLWQSVAGLAARAYPERKPAPIVVRALIPPGKDYEEATREYAPFSMIHHHLPGFPELAAAILRTAIAEKREAYFLVGNLLEGSAPLSVARIADAMLRPNQ